MCQPKGIKRIGGKRYDPVSFHSHRGKTISNLMFDALRETGKHKTSRNLFQVTLETIGHLIQQNNTAFIPELSKYIASSNGPNGYNYTSNTALIHPSFSGLFVTWAYFAQTTFPD